MPIVASRVVEDALQKDGRRYFRYGHTDHNDKEYVTHVRLVPSDYVADADADAPRQEIELALQENGDAISRVENGEDSLVVAQAFNHSTEQAISQELIYEMMERLEDVYFVLAMEPLMEDMRARFNAAELATYLLLNNAGELGKINQKYDAVLRSESDIETAKVSEQVGRRA